MVRRDPAPLLYNAWRRVRTTSSRTTEPVMSNASEVPNPGAGAPVSGTHSLPPRRIRVLGVPLDMGASRRGVDMGPSAVRVAGLEARLEALGHRVTDGGNIRVDIAETQ